MSYVKESISISQRALNASNQISPRPLINQVGPSCLRLFRVMFSMIVGLTWSRNVFILERAHWLSKESLVVFSLITVLAARLLYLLTFPYLWMKLLAITSCIFFRQGDVSPTHKCEISIYMSPCDLLQSYPQRYQSTKKSSSPCIKQLQGR